MLTKNFGRSYSGRGKTEIGKIPRPVNGDTTNNTKKTTYDSTLLNAWCHGTNVDITSSTSYIENVFYNHHGCLSTKGSVSSGTGSGDIKYFYKDNFIQNGSFFVDVGFGNTPATADDYHLEDSNAEMVTPILTHKYGVNHWNAPIEYIIEDGCILLIDSVYENQTDADIVVKEMGLMWKPGSTLNNSGTYSNPWTCCTYLLARTVFSSPVTIHPNEVYKFSYKIKV